jgi:protein dithiol:quinone oxidoreductase
MMFEPQKRFSWMLFLLSALSFVGAALYFQYGMKLNPNVLCIYQRGALSGVALGGLLGFLFPTHLAPRVLAYLAIGVSAVFGLRFAIQHVVSLTSAWYDCSLMPDFPAWLSLHEWLPVVFQPKAMCDEADWAFLGFTMSEIMVGVFAAYLTGLAYTSRREFEIVGR